jgi:Legionella pneumophila major outer membrane protein precursor
MLKNLSKVAVAVLALGSSAVSAGTMGPVCTPGNVTVPCERCGWDFGGYALYLQSTLDCDDFGGLAKKTFLPMKPEIGPVNGVNDGGLDDNHPTPEPEFDRTLGRAEFPHSTNQWGWGFKLEGSYHFHTGNDINVNWYHLNNSNNRRFDVFRNRFNPKWDAVNVELGQHVDFSEWKVIRFHGGFQFVRLTQDRRTRFDNDQLEDFVERFRPVFAEQDADFLFDEYEGDHSRNRNRFTGFGPRFGLDMSYNVGNGVAIYADGAAALLIGSARFNRNVNPLFTHPLIANEPEFPGGLAAFGGCRRHTTMVPELEGRLGAKYVYSCPQGDLTLDAGYLWINYFNAMPSINSNVFSSNCAVNNVAFNGPIFGVKWVGWA